MQYKIKTDRNMKEYNDIILVSLAKSARSVINNIQSTLTDLLGGVGGMLTLDNPSEDNTFMDYDGRTYMLTGIVREKMGITLCGYLMDELNGTDMETEHKVRSYCYDRIQLLNVVMAFEREIDERKEQEENEDD